MRDVSDVADVRVRVRRASAADVDGVCGFGRDVVPAHYSPLLGDERAARQVTLWWSADRISEAAAAGRVLVAELAGVIVGVAERGEWDGDQVIWKLYLRSEHRSCGLGPVLIAALVEDMPAAAPRVLIEHFAANARAAAFYEREGFHIDRVEQHPGPDRGLDTVWRSRALT